MLLSPFAKLMTLLGLFMFVVILIEDWTIITIRSVINSKKDKK